VLVHLFMYLILNKKSFLSKLHCAFPKIKKSFIFLLYNCTRNHVFQPCQYFHCHIYLHDPNITNQTISKEKYFPFLVEHQNFISKHFLRRKFSIESVWLVYTQFIYTFARAYKKEVFQWLDISSCLKNMKNFALYEFNIYNKWLALWNGFLFPTFWS